VGKTGDGNTHISLSLLRWGWIIQVDQVVALGKGVSELSGFMMTCCQKLCKNARAKDGVELAFLEDSLRIEIVGNWKEEYNSICCAGMIYYLLLFQLDFVSSNNAC
jgi:hypothetical protein